jgi:hypothetical protein
MEISVVLALVSMAMSLPIILLRHTPPRRSYSEGPVRRPLSPERRERCRCGQCEQCDPLHQSYGR